MKQLQDTRYIFAILFLIAVASPASAILTIQVSDGVNTFTTPDGGPNDLSPQTGAVVYTNTFGNVILNVDSGISKPIIGSVAVPELHLDSLLLSSGPANLTVALSDTGFSGAGLGSFLASIGGIINSANGSTATYSVYRDLSNTLFGISAGTLVCTTGLLGGGSLLNFGGSCFGKPTLDDAYSLTLLASINHLGAGNSSFNAVLVDAPELASVILLGLGLIGVTAWSRCKATSSHYSASR